MESNGPSDFWKAHDRILLLVFEIALIGMTLMLISGSFRTRLPATQTHVEVAR